MEIFPVRCLVVFFTFSCFLNIFSGRAIAAPSDNVSVLALDILPISSHDTTFTMEIKVGLMGCDTNSEGISIGWFDDKMYWQFSNDEERIGEPYTINLNFDALNPTQRNNGDEGMWTEISDGVAINIVFHVDLPIREKFQALSPENQNSVNKVVVILQPFRFQCIDTINDNPTDERQLWPRIAFNYFDLIKTARRQNSAPNIRHNWHDPETENETEPKIPDNWHESKNIKPRQIFTRCGLGWSPHAQFQHQRDLPKAMIYALEFEYDPQRYQGYTCKVIEIRIGDASLENLAGWQLYLGRLYDPSRIPLSIPKAHSQVTDRILRLTPDMFGLETFPCRTVNNISRPLPGVHYVLRTDENLVVDTAYSCFVWGQNAWTTVEGVSVQSLRRLSSARLREMEVPRLERYILDTTNVYITHTSLEAFTWDRAVLSDWLLPEPEVSAPAAPSVIRRKLSTTWGALKRQRQ